jgi:hypothetical protein
VSDLTVPAADVNVIAQGGSGPGEKAGSESTREKNPGASFKEKALKTAGRGEEPWRQQQGEEPWREQGLRG